MILAAEWEEQHMRPIAFVLAAVVVSAPAYAEWKEFTDISEGFAVTFPAPPTVEDVAKFEIAPGKMVPAHIYSASAGKSDFKVTIAEGRGAGVQEALVIDQAMTRLKQGGELKMSLPHRIWAVYGRQVAIAHPDGSITKAAVFYVNDRLYQIDGTTHPGGSDSDLIRFQQSLILDRNATNRTPQQIAAIKAACLGVLQAPSKDGAPPPKPVEPPPGQGTGEEGYSVAEAGSYAMPAGLDDPRCVQH